MKKLDTAGIEWLPLHCPACSENHACVHFPLQIYFISFNHVLVCVAVCGHVHVSTGAHRGQKTVSVLLDRDLRKLWATWCGCWEPNSGSLQEQPLLSSSELSFQPLKYFFLILEILQKSNVFFKRTITEQTTGELDGIEQFCLNHPK